MIELLTTYNIVIGISVVINIVLLIGVRNLLKQNEQLEDRLARFKEMLDAQSNQELEEAD